MNIKTLSATAISTASIIFLIYSTIVSHVPSRPTQDDIRYIKIILKSNLPTNASTLNYEQQIDLIKYIQKSILDYTDNTIKAIPQFKEREPKNIFTQKVGACHDRSRFIEKALSYSGLQVRHLFLLSSPQERMLDLLKKGQPSHSITEVLTKKGWLAVDSNYSWLSLSKSGLPIPAEEIYYSYTSNKLAINPPEPIYTKPFLIISGLYSRHGKFYPPYNFIPDYNFSMIIKNFN